MGTIYAVRHAQASFGTSEYDRLTEIGFAQARLLGAYFAARNIRFDAVFAGTLRRHRETVSSLFEGFPESAGGPPPEFVFGLNEYDPTAVIAAFAGAAPPLHPAAAKRDAGVVREHFRLLREALMAWADARTQPLGMPTWQAFQEGAVAAVIDARQRYTNGNVLIVSSGGPIAAIVAATLRAPSSTAIELNLRIRNSSVTEFASSSRRHQLVSFNALPHLGTGVDASLTTYT
jgi:broad specificity phosphatase PhoE